jgi:hypothetical protein
MSDEYKRHFTPAPRSLKEHATLADVVDEVGDHRESCAARRRKFSMWAIGTGVAAAGVAVTLGIFLARFLIVGAITIELDRRFPQMHLAHRAAPSGVLMGNAVAAEASPPPVPK